MPIKHCKGCGQKIPRNIPHSKKKTASYRKFCYNCSPLKSNHLPAEKGERKKRKEKLVKMLGGRCAACGYNYSIRALSFHHKDPSTKCFNISSNGHLLQDWDIVVSEAKKCKLLCLNCHAEVEEAKRMKEKKTKSNKGNVKNKRRQTKKPKNKKK